MTSKRASHSRSSSRRRIRAAFAVDPPEGVAVPLGAAFLRQGEARVGLDDRQRRAQLVRRVGGELHLPLARLLDGRRDAPADGDGAQEHDDEQDRPDAAARRG